MSTKKNKNQSKKVTKASENRKNAMTDDFRKLKDYVVDYGSVILPIILLICSIITVIFALGARQRVQAAEVEAREALESSEVEINEAMEIPFEENAYEELNKLFASYYDALAKGDLDTLLLLKNNVSKTEQIRLNAMSKYIDHYDNMVVYSKIGPFPDSFVTFVYTDVYLVKQEIATPGLQAFYVCHNNNGYYINSGELTDVESEYIELISNQADVKDLKNTVSVKYNNLLEENEELNAYWADISVKIDMEVTDNITEQAAQEAARLEEEQRALEEAAKAAEENQSEAVEETSPVILIGTVGDSAVNVRKSPSTEAEKIGGLGAHKSVTVIEVMDNGWTKVEFKDETGYIFSELLTVKEQETTNNVKTNGSIVATDVVKVRKEPNTACDRIGILNKGETAGFIEEADGWYKVKFNGEIGYVNAEYATRQEDE